MNGKYIFINGGTGYMGSRLIPVLLSRGHRVRALSRLGSEGKLPEGCEIVVGNAIDGSTYVRTIAPCDTFIQLVGVAHPGPSKGAQFRQIDLPSGLEAVKAAVAGRIDHFIYVSVAHPSSMMKEYIQVRVEVEEAIQISGLNATILRPWYVLGPGHNWSVLLKPFYAVLERFEKTRESARRLALVTLDQMIGAFVHAVEHPSQGLSIFDVPRIREFSSASPDPQK